MYKHTVKLTDNVEDQTLAYKSKFSNLEKTMRDLSQGGLFEQIDALVQEVKRLTALTEKYEVRYFLLGMEIERRGKIIGDYVNEIESYRDSLIRKDREHIRELEKIREEETYKIRRVLETEIENLKLSYTSERTKLERKVHEYQAEIGHKDSENNDLKHKISNLLETITKLKIDNEDLSTSLKTSESRKDYEISRLRSEQQNQAKDMESRMRAELELLKRQMGDERQKDVEKQTRLVTDYYSDQLRQKDTEMGRVRTGFEQSTLKVKELEAEINGLTGILTGKTRENQELRDQLSQMKSSFEDLITQMDSDHQSAIQKVTTEKEKERDELISIEMDRFNKEIRDKKSKIQDLEHKIQGVDQELQGERRRVDGLLSTLEETRSKLDTAQKNLTQEIQIVEETYMVQVEEKDNEIMNLLMQIKELHSMYENKIALEATRADNLATENELYKKEIHQLKELSEVRAKEIDEWRLKYRGYITGDEAVNMRDEVNRLRRVNMQMEENNTQLKLDVARFGEKVKATEAEVETRDHEISSLKELVARRRDEVLSVQQENDKLTSKLRSMIDQKDNVDAQQMISEEHFLNLQQELQQLKEQRDMYKDDYERSQTQLAMVNRKYAENLKEQEEMMKKFKNATITTTVRSSQMISRGEMKSAMSNN